MLFKCFYICCAAALLAFTFYWMFYNETEQSSKVAEGKMIWQKYNCQACHQIYGLGGYLGPDLTNLFARPGRTPEYVTALILSGNKVMPAFNMSEMEVKMLIQFLEAINKTGDADAMHIKHSDFGMVQ